MAYKNILSTTILFVSHTLLSFLSAAPFYYDSQVQKLREHLIRYEEIKKKGGWPFISEKRYLEVGMTDPTVKTLKRYLLLTGDLNTNSVRLNDTFDLALSKAVKEFQKKHSIMNTGVVAKKTLHELNIPVEKRIQQIQLNIERWKSMPDTFNDKYVMVNLPAASFELIYKDSLKLKMKVIIGKNDRKTPLLKSELTMIEFNPYWVVPPRVMEKDILPELIKDPDYIEEHEMRVYHNSKEIDPKKIKWNLVDPKNCPYQVIQDPGVKNPMGRVKFIFPNNHFVYMHDTPFKNLFNASSISFSSGCIRLSNAMRLAEILLEDDLGWEKSVTSSLADSESTIKVELREPIKIYLAYFTAWVNTDGNIHFAPDIYLLDK